MDGCQALCGDHVMALIKVRIKDPCPLGLPDILTVAYTGTPGRCTAKTGFGSTVTARSLPMSLPIQEAEFRAASHVTLVQAGSSERIRAKQLALSHTRQQLKK